MKWSNLIRMKCICVCVLFILTMVTMAKQFPDDFIFGVGSSSYQIEGAWNESGKSPSIWDTFVHSHPYEIKDGSNGDVACDSYHKIKEDIEMLKELGVQFYRFSISWPRLLPKGHTGDINEDGVRYYNELIDELIRNNIIPFITLYHWDLPQALEEIGGWMNPMMEKYFESYSLFAFQQYGDRVQYWTTFNEPIATCWGYNGKNWPPKRDASGFGDYICAHNILKAHARAYRAFKSEAANVKGGKIGIVLGSPWYEPETNTTKDIEARDRLLAMEAGWYLHPIYSKEGDYPKIMRERVDHFSREENIPWSRLPVFTKEEIEMIRGSADFLGLNHYTTMLVRNGKDDEFSQIPSNERDVGVIKSLDPDWTTSPVLHNATIIPYGFYKLLLWLKENYNPVIYITENGFPDPDKPNDVLRIQYMQEYISAVGDAINAGVNVKGYAAWCLMDNFEWMYGYTVRYGLYSVDFNDPERPRKPNKSAYVYKDIIAKRKVQLKKTIDVN